MDPTIALAKADLIHPGVARRVTLHEDPLAALGF